MKKNFVLVTALALGLASIGSAQTPAAPGAKAPTGALPTKIAIINVQQAIMTTGEGKKAAAEMQVKFNPRQEVLKKAQADIQGMQDQMKKGSATMSDDAKNKLSRDIDAKMKSFQRDADEINADIEQENNRLMQELGNKMQAVWDKYLSQNGFALMIDVSSQQSPVLWAAAALDVTTDLVGLYDQAHPVTAGAAPAPKTAAPAPAKK